MTNLREEVEKILGSYINYVLTGDGYGFYNREQATDQILQATNKCRLPCEHLTFKTQNGKIIELFIDGEEWKSASPK